MRRADDGAKADEAAAEPAAAAAEVAASAASEGPGKGAGSEVVSAKARAKLDPAIAATSRDATLQASEGGFPAEAAAA
eukprot:2030970-Pyramimonas_sp.AAC.1